MRPAPGVFCRVVRLAPFAALAFCRPLPHKAPAHSVGMSRMFDSTRARRNMVDGQVRTADVTNPDLIAAMLEVSRERFVPAGLEAQAYLDGEITIAPGRGLLRPMVLARLLQAARVSDRDHVLDVGCGLGYSAALLVRLAGSVVALEADASLAGQAKAALAANGATRAMVVSGPLPEGWRAAAPYDLILLNGATEIVPDALGRQLKPDGRLVCMFGRSPGAKGMIFRLAEGRLVGRAIFDAATPLLPGFTAAPAFVF
jgi:protein-L-isoaspartate(D-aspartate) O-methyltransferase